jgi:hypothetical protein
MVVAAIIAAAGLALLFACQMPWDLRPPYHEVAGRPAASR